jgi:hypothetical protein
MDLHTPLEELRMTRSYFAAAGLMVALSIGFISGCAKSEGKFAAQDLTGQWTGDSQGVHTMIGYAQTTRTLTVTDQEGNQFRGTLFYKTTSSAQLREGTEKVYGSINPVDGKITIITDEDHGVLTGTFADHNTLNLTYTDPGPGGIVGNITLTRVAE